MKHTMKRLLSMLIVICMVVGMMPVQAFATVKVDVIRAPKTGNMPMTKDDIKLTSLDLDMSVHISSLIWTPNGTDDFNDDGSFKGGKVYTVTMEVALTKDSNNDGVDDDGYYLPKEEDQIPDFKVSVNGSLENMEKSNVDGKLVYTYTFPATEGGEEPTVTPITSVDTRLLQYPATDKSISKGFSINSCDPVSSGGYTGYASIYVCDTDSNTFADWTSASGKYAASKYYMVATEVRANEGYAFDDSLTKTIGGLAHDDRFDSQFTNTDTIQTIVHIYGPLEEPEAVSSLAFTVPEPKVGEKVDWSTWSVSGNPDGSVKDGESSFYVSDTNPDEESDLTYIANGTEFQAGKYYVFIGEGVATDGYQLTSSTTKTVNGEPHDDRFDADFDSLGLAVHVWGPLEAAPEVTKYDVWVAGTQVTSANAADVLGDGAASYNAATNTLTVSKNIAATGSNEAIYASTTEDFNVVIADGVTLTSELHEGIDYWGDGALTVTGEDIVINADEYAIYGLHDVIVECGNIDLTGYGGICGNEDVNIKCDKLDIDGYYGVSAYSGSLELTAEDVTIEADSNAIHGYTDVIIDCNKLSVATAASGGINSGTEDIAVNSKEITIISPSGDAVQAAGDIDITGDKLNIAGRNGFYTSSGAVDLNVKEISIGSTNVAISARKDSTIDCDKLSVESVEYGAISIAPGKLTINGSENSELTIVSPKGDAVQGYNGVTIKGGKLDITGNYGIYTANGTLELTVKEISVESKHSAIFGNESVTIDCDTATVVAGTIGLNTAGSIIIKNGVFDIQSTDESASEPYNSALYFEDSFTYPAGATVVAATKPNGDFVPYVAADNATYDHVKIDAVEDKPVCDHANDKLTLTFEDEKGHWSECKCGEYKTDLVPHEFEDDADANCDCGYERVAGGVEPEEKPEVKPVIPSDDDYEEDDYSIVVKVKFDGVDEDEIDEVNAILVRNGKAYKNKDITEKKDWKHEWTGLDDNKKWSVDAKEIAGYNVDVDNVRGNYWVITISKEAEKVNPETGASEFVGAVVALAACSAVCGAALMLKRK